MAVSKSDCCLMDFPTEIYEVVFSYLPDIDLIRFRHSSILPEDSFRRLIRRKGRKLDFSKCYHLREEDLMHVLTLGRDYITSVNVNHCYWLTPDCLDSIMRLPKLQELHIIDCEISSLLQIPLIPVGLIALSISWDRSWLKVLREVNDVGNEYASQLFGQVKRLTIHTGMDMNLNDAMYHIAETVLTHCLNLDTLQVHEARLWSPVASQFIHSQFEYKEGLLPKLSKLYVQLNSVSSIPKWLRAIFMLRETPLSEVYLGMASYFLLESYRVRDLTQLNLLCINAEEIPVVCLDSGGLSCPTLCPIPKIWKDRWTPKCKVVSLQGLTLSYMSDTSKLVAELGPQLQELNLRNCKVDINYLFMGLTIIAKYCTQLTKLDLTLHSSVMTNDDSNNTLLIAVSQFKALKVLYVSVGLLSRSKSIFYPERVLGHQKSRVGSQLEISEKSMRSSEMWTLTQRCMEIKDFRLTNDTWTDDRVVCECALACISNWKDLKELHLVNIPTLGRACFLPFITRNCPQLTNLYLANVCCEGPCRYTRALIESLSHATRLKDLSIVQDMELSSVLSKALGRCLDLERMYWQSLVMNAEECDRFFFNLLSKLPQLILVWIESTFMSTDMISSVVLKLDSLKGSRPSFVYSLNNRVAPTAPIEIYKSFVDHWPIVHLELARYKTVRKC